MNQRHANENEYVSSLDWIADAHPIAGKKPALARKPIAKKTKQISFDIQSLRSVKYLYGEGSSAFRNDDRDITNENNNESEEYQGILKNLSKMDKKSLSKLFDLSCELVKISTKKQLPDTAPELYSKRENRSEKIIPFIVRVYGEYLDGISFTRTHFRKFDPKGAASLDVWLTKNELPEKLDFPTDSELSEKQKYISIDAAAKVIDKERRRAQRRPK